MRRITLALALAVGVGGCLAGAGGNLPAIDPSPEVSPVEASLDASSPKPASPPLPILPIVKRLHGFDRLFLYDAIAQDVVEIPEASMGGPILNPFYFEREGEGRVLYNSGGERIECPPGSGLTVPDVTTFGAYVFDLGRRLRYRQSEDDYFRSVTSAEGRIFAHLDATTFPAPHRIQLILTGPVPFDVEAIVAALGLEPGLLVDIAMAAGGRWIAAVKGEPLAEDCRFPPPVAGRLFLYDLETFQLFRLSEAYDLPFLRAVALSPSARQVVMLAGDQVVRLDRLTGLQDPMPILNDVRGGGKFRAVRFVAGLEGVFFVEHRPAGGISRILAYDWQAQRVNLLPMINLLGEAADKHLAPP